MAAAQIIKLDQIEAELRRGNPGLVREALKDINCAKVPRADILRVANLARRCGLLDLGLRLLNPIIRGESGLLDPPSPLEQIEYAVLLVRIGAIWEARQILEGIDSAQYPDALLYLTFALTPEWRYGETIPLLRQYILVTEDRPYQSLVAKVNLVAALIYERHDEEITPLLHSSLEFAERNGHRLLWGNLLELGAQWAIQTQKYSEAKSFLEKSIGILGGAEITESLYVEKWNSILKVCEKPGLAERQDLLHIRQKAQARMEWEIVRDCDYYLALKYQEEKLFLHLYFGTPFQSYRERLLRNFQLSGGLPSSYRWSLGEGAAVEGEFLHASTGTNSWGKKILHPGRLPHKFLMCLSQDFYRPQRPAALGAILFPGEHFDPVHTTQRLYKACTRLRGLLEKEGLPLRVHVTHGAFSLVSTEPYAIGKTIEMDESLRAHHEIGTEVFMDQLRAKKGLAKFTSIDAAKIWACSQRTAARRLESACHQGICARGGRGRGTYFHFSS